jgi:hypothetical protein
LKANPDRIDWVVLSLNPAAIDMLEANEHLIHWGQLSQNPAAIHLLEQNQDKIEYYLLSKNPAIFTYDYERMSRPFTEELMANRFHPRNLNKFELWGYE